MSAIEIKEKKKRNRWCQTKHRRKGALTSWGDITVGKTEREAFLARLDTFLNMLWKNLINKSTLLSASSSSLSSSIPSYSSKPASSTSYGSPPPELFSFRTHKQKNMWNTIEPLFTSNIKYIMYVCMYVIHTLPWQLVVMGFKLWLR